MKRSGSPARKTPLTAKTPLKRTAALTSSPLSASAKHRNSVGSQRKRTPASPPRVPVKVRAALAVRSGGLCEIGQQGCTGWAVDPSHRVRTGMGGRKGAALAAHHVLSNLLHACRWCHDRNLHANPSAAYAAGWMLRDGSNSLAVPALYRGAWMFLDDQGSVSPVPLIAEEA